MKKKFLLISVCTLAFAAGYTINNPAISNPEGYKVAIVDVTALVSKSSQVNALKAEQDKKLTEIKNTIEKAQQEISKETDSKKIAQLEEKYRNEVNAQKLALDSEYAAKLKQIDNDIKAVVVSKAKDMKYNLVLPKSIVLSGGDDITAEVAKAVK